MKTHETLPLIWCCRSAGGTIVATRLKVLRLEAVLPDCYDVSDGKIVSVRKGNVKVMLGIGQPLAGRPGGNVSMQSDSRTPTHLVDDFDIRPTHPQADTGSERLQNSLLSGKTRG